MFSRDISQWKTGPLSIAIPGQFAGLYTAQKQYGKLPWEELVKPAENLAHKGFIISSSLFKKIAYAESDIKANYELKCLFAPNGTLLIEGNTIRLRKLADTLAAIAKHGMDIFYNGTIGQCLADDIQNLGGIIIKEDFQKYRAITRKPLIAHVLGHEVVTVLPPASGGAMMILGGQVKAVVGAAGGLLIPDAVTQVLINYLKENMDPFVAVTIPRFYRKVRLFTNAFSIV
ncbi:Gamma-glutamyltransferase [Handroanthus impetiginosus]|uniref:Gamma-glutamyltransferase n=1 Tax=Handroanthus impetiginosus TaxID=429701 RepID=A0A2G9GHY8_9LAMI|nr:Gamma-glutamyltransferase [Handroanthus impetiginosus]